MERATQRDERGYYLTGDGIYSDCGAPEKFRGEDIDSLAAYEDTGLEPGAVEHLKLASMGKAIAEITEFEGIPIDRLRELAEADREGRCVVLPFKPPRWVYMCSARFTHAARAYYASAINVLQDMDKGCVFGDTPEEAEAALAKSQLDSRNVNSGT